MVSGKFLSSGYGRLFKQGKFSSFLTHSVKSSSIVKWSVLANLYIVSAVHFSILVFPFTISDNESNKDLLGTAMVSGEFLFFGYG
mgnify:CR=1 FL=1